MVFRLHPEVNVSQQQLPDPSAPPTVATFGGGPPQAPPAPAASTAAAEPRKLTPEQFEAAKAQAQATAQRLASPDAKMDPAQLSQFFQQVQRVENSRKPQPTPVPIRPPATIQTPVSPEDRVRAFMKDGNDYGERIAGFMSTFLPEVSLGVSLVVSEGTLQWNVAAYIPAEDPEVEEDQVLATMAADPDALGEAIHAVAVEARKALQPPAERYTRF